MFVFGFHARWRADHVNRFVVRAHWAYEFSAKTRMELARAEAQKKKDATAEEQARRDIETSAWVEYEACWDAEPHIPSNTQVSLPPRSAGPAPGEIKRFILLNARLPRRGGNPKKR